MYCNLYDHRTLSLFFKIYIQKQANQNSGTVTCKQALPLLCPIAICFLIISQTQVAEFKSIVTSIREVWGISKTMKF